MKAVGRRWSIVSLILCALPGRRRAATDQDPASGRAPLQYSRHRPNFAAFRQGLRELGYVDGQNLLIEHHSAERKPEQLPDLAAELVRSKPDLIFALGGDVVPFAQKATKTIPNRYVGQQRSGRDGFR